MATEKYSNFGTSTLLNSIDGSQTTLVVVSAAFYPTTGNFRLLVDSELMLVTGVVGTTFTVTRGVEGTSAVSHSASAQATAVLTKSGFDTILAEMQQAGAITALPAVEKAGRIYRGTDFPMDFRDTGAAWDPYHLGRKLTLPIPGDYAWTHGGGTATDTTVANGPTFLKVTSTGSGDKMSLFTKNVPSAPYSVITTFTPLLTPASISYCGMCLYDGTKIVLFHLVLATGVLTLRIQKFTNITTFSADYVIQSGLPFGFPMALRIEDDNTNRICSYSTDGYNFVQIHTIGRTDFLTPTKIGMHIGTNATATTNGSPTVSSLNWLSWVQSP